MLSSSFEEENLIAKDELAKHNVQKYEFKSIIKNPDDEIEQKIIESSIPVASMNVSAEAQEIKKPSSSLEKDLIERLLQKTDELSGSLAKLQIQFEKQQLEIEERVNAARNDGYKDGLKEGEEKAKKKCSIRSKKKRLPLSNQPLL